MDPFADLDEAVRGPATVGERARQHLDDLLDATGTTARAVAVGIVALGVVVGALWWSSRAAPVPVEATLPLVAPADAVPTSAPDTAPVVVHVAGAVLDPGVVVLAPGARGIDAVRAAGGLAADADADRINLAGPVQDGQHLVVPREGEPLPASTSPEASNGDGRIDLNTATAEVLQTLNGIGPATAAAIVEDRDRNGPFATVDELLRVRGIGEAKLAAIREHLRV